MTNTTSAPQLLDPLLQLAAATAVGSVGLAAGGTAGALAAAEITGSTGAAGFPLGTLVVGSGAGALLISWWTRRTGRRAALAGGYLVGTAGAIITAAAIGMQNFGLLLVGSAALGFANAAVFLSRYAAADNTAGAHRGRTMGLILAAAAIGAVAGPNLLGPGGALADAVGLPRVAGVYLVAVLSFGLAAALLWRGGRGAVEDASRHLARTPVRIAAPMTRRALAVLGATNLAMVATMAIAPVHMEHNGHGLTVVGFVVSGHVLCMFAPAALWGRLGDRAGHHVVIALGAGLLIAAGVAGAGVNTAHAGAMAAVLALLGLGWSAGVVGASAMLVGSVPDAARPRVEGYGEVAMSLAAGGGAPLAGVLASSGGFAALCLAAAAVGLAALTAVWQGAAERPAAGSGVSA